jgi:hypothetical protein
VETFVFWRAGWLLHVHHFTARQPVVFRLGGFALPVQKVDPVLRAGLNPPGTAGSTLAVFNGEKGTVLQPLLGFIAHEWDTRLDDSTERRHVAAPYHATPIIKSARLTGPGILAALSWSGTDRAESASWRVVAGSAGQWQLTHPQLGDWEIRHWSLPALSP